MDRQTLSFLAHVDHPIAAPLSDSNVGRLLRQVGCSPGASVLDLGCGAGEWVLRALEEYPTARAFAVDTSEPALRRAEETTRDRGLRGRVIYAQGDAREYRPPKACDLVMCVGATHAFGGFEESLRAIDERVAPGGTVLIGEGFWERPPTRAALDALDAVPEDFQDLAGTVETAEKAGWTPVYGHVSELGEWDEYEWSWTGSLTRWALDHPEHPDAEAAIEAAREHRDGWLRGYRGVLGFVCLLLRRKQEHPPRA
ncbi:class I SAM-dependent methyltransferase [Saccharopolyspora sp. WRP15-2]|uniref:Class I SAM-dependent methyltransferase n=1 Tax=Saccharopolyspora oryzae TaxID=2997343 RepID=A0ABT4V1Q2_9PSEU|nr:class I SAM-dependent methyltransferase [Saccharopolyspora oryzae]MDA3627376.1 class I SAM-dependent methyltransferase [Saccharopolyspora oryzae]